MQYDIQLFLLDDGYHIDFCTSDKTVGYIILSKVNIYWAFPGSDARYVIACDT